MSDELRQALDDAVLRHTGRSIGDMASQRVLDDIMPYIVSLQQSENAALREIALEVINASWYTHSSTLGGPLVMSACCPFPECEKETATGHYSEIPHTQDCPVTKARALLRQSAQEVE